MNIAIIGYGKMGKTIEAIAVERGHHVVLKIGSSNIADLTEKNLETVDVAIEFSLPDLAFNHIKLCLNSNTPIVVGTTGWYDKEKDVNQLVKQTNGSFLAATNFSVGVNIFFEINRRLSELMGKQDSYTAEIQEIHHTEKLDSPSGTAITLAEDIQENHSKYTSWKNNPTEEQNTLEIKSFREPGVPGTHEVRYDSEIDKISIKHEAKNRKGFALGAVLAAEYIQPKQGIFTMQDVLKN